MVSVLLPARDAAATVEAAVRSILGQTLGNLELLAVDDGSQDATGALLAGLAREDARVRVLHTGGQGLVAALQLALAEARGTYLARMDADDVSLPRRLEASVAALEAEPHLTGVAAGVELFRDDVPPSPSMRAYVAWLNTLSDAQRLYRERFIESPLCHPAVCLRTDAVREAGGWRHGDFPEDYELWLRLLERGGSLRSLGEVLFRWRDAPVRLTRTDPRYARRRFTWLKGQYLLRAPETQGRVLTLMGTGPEGLALLRYLRDAGARLERLVDVHPRKVGTLLEGLPVVHPDALGPPEGDLKLLCVGLTGVRDDLRALLQRTGHVEGRDFLCVA